MKKIIFFIMTLLTSSLFSSCSVYSPSELGYKTIYSAEAKEIMNTEKNIVILDVRTQNEYDSGHMLNSILIPYTEIVERAEQLIPDKQSKILVYCQSGVRSLIACKKLVKLGYTNVYNLGALTNREYEIVK